MKILFVYSSEFIKAEGGVQRVSVVLGEYFSANQIEVFFLSLNRKSNKKLKGSNHFFLPQSSINSEENHGFLKELVLKKEVDINTKIVERVLESELNHDLGYSKHSKVPKSASNRRNGSYEKTIIDDEGHKLSIDVPRDRDSEFTPKLIPKGIRRFSGFDDKVISLYSRGMTMSEIQGHLEEIYHTEVSKELISTVTDSVIEEVTKWQNRSLDIVYPILYLDCIHVKARDSNTIINKAVYLAIAVNMEGKKELLGIWIGKNEGSKFWMQVVTELKNRGVQKIYVACVDGLKGFPEAINSIFPDTVVQLCIVHMIRNSVKYVSYKDLKEVTSDLKKIYTANTDEIAHFELKSFASKWDGKYPVISDIWQRNWSGIIPFFAFPAEIRKVIYTTNSIESVNRQIRKIIKNKGVFFILNF